MTEHIVGGAAPYERSSVRTGLDATVTSRGLFEDQGRHRGNLLVPQDREGTFSTGLFSRYQQNEKALVLALMEMYVEGVSTRKVKEVTPRRCVAPPSPRASSRASSPRSQAAWTQSS